MINTVTGQIKPSDMGITLMHEHFLWDQSCWLKYMPDDPRRDALMHQKITLENRGEIATYYPHGNLDNIIHKDISLTIEEVERIKNYGGRTILECSNIGLGRDSEALKKVAETTGLNVIMGSGFYVAESHPEYVRGWGKENIAELIIQEFEKGIEPIGIKPGFIGEIGISDINNTEERKMLQGAAMAQKELNVPLLIHPPIFDTYGLKILDIVEGEGGHLNQTVLCHCDPTINISGYHESIAERGAMLSFDQFGIEFVGVERIFLPRDIERVRAVAQLIKNGYGKQIVLSQDICFKTSFMKYGGLGYAHILRDMIGFMLEEGISREQINDLLIHNPATVFAG